MTVGDDELLVGHGADDEIEDGGVVDGPEAMEDAVVVGDFDFGSAALREEELLDALDGIGVEHEDLAEVGTGGAEQIQAVGFRFGKGLLMAEDDGLFVVDDLAQSDEAAALSDGSGIAGDGIDLAIGVDGGLVLGDKDFLFAPLAKILSRTGVDVVALVIEKLRQAEDDADEVEGAALVINLLERRSDLVVGLRNDVVEANLEGVITKSCKGIDAGHAELWRPTSRADRSAVFILPGGGSEVCGGEFGGQGG
jgi:hypothetical protein